MKTDAKNMTQREGARDLVERARMGDQNAMGMLVMVGNNARAGNPRAMTAYNIIQEFIKKNPVTVVMGAEEQGAIAVLKEPSNPIPVILRTLCNIPLSGTELLVQAACLALANSTPVTKEKIAQVNAILPSPAQPLFQYGFENSNDSKKLGPLTTSLPPEAVGVLCAGHCYGMARRIQLARLPNVSIAILSPEIAWELGCDGGKR